MEGWKSGRLEGGRREACWLRSVAMGFLFLAGSEWCDAANESGLWELWELHIEYEEDHERVVAACRTFEGKNSEDPLLPVVHGLEAWHEFRREQPARALRLLKPYSSSGEGWVHRGSEILANAWVTRLQRDRIVEALQHYYRVEIRYPKRLEELAAHSAVPKALHPTETDRWGTRWDYRLVGFDGTPGFLDQRYVLESIHLRGTSDYKKALEVSIEESMRLVPVQVSDGGEAKVVRFENTDPGGGNEVVALSPGGEAHGVYLAFVGEHLIVICDRLHWAVFRGPGRDGRK
jgi:hypothetical protein